MRRIDGREVQWGLEVDTDVVVVGSGPAGATVARQLAAAGLGVVVVEAGHWLEPSDAERSAFAAMSAHYRDMGASVMMGRAPLPYLQGRAVGGGSVINGAICWRLPRDSYDAFVAADPAFEEAIPWRELEEATDEVEADLNVRPTDPAVAGPKNLLLGLGAERLGLEHRPIRRNVRACRGLGLCLQACPEDHKLSLDRTYLRDAEAEGAMVMSGVEVRRVLTKRGRAVGVRGRADGGAGVTVNAKHALVLAASAIQTPALLLRSGIRHGPVGRNLMCHPGVSMAGRFAEPVRMWEGATQGHEVTGLRSEGIKIEALGFGPAVLAMRLAGVGGELAANIADMDHWLDWGGAIRASGSGRVRSIAGQTAVTFDLSKRDIRQFRRALRVLGELMFAAGAERVHPGVFGWDEEVTDPRRLQDLERNGPHDPRAFVTAATHLFGTCQMGSKRSRSVVGLDFRHHAIDRLYIADSSVFPSNIGVNPQIPIMAMASLCARRILS